MEVGATVVGGGGTAVFIDLVFAVVGGGGTAVFIDLVFAEELVPVVKVHIGKREGGEEVGRKKFYQARNFGSSAPSIIFFLTFALPQAKAPRLSAV